MRLRIVWGCLILAIVVTCSIQQPGEESADKADVSSEKELGRTIEVSSERSILFLGNSLTAGYLIDPELAFPSLIQKKLDQAGLPFRVFNAGISGDTTASGLSRLDWYLKGEVDILFLELGANDGMRGVPLEATSGNLQGIIDRFKERYPDGDVIVAGMVVSESQSDGYSSRFGKVFSSLAEKNSCVLIPFLLEGVAGRLDLNLPDGIHPTPKGHEIVADHVWTFLEPVVRSRLEKKESE
jgi:acyl-CoA thioesterase-1